METLEAQALEESNGRVLSSGEKSDQITKCKSGENSAYPGENRKTENRDNLGLKREGIKKKARRSEYVIGEWNGNPVYRYKFVIIPLSLSWQNGHVKCPNITNRS